MTPLLEDEATLWSASLDHDDRAFGTLFDLHRDRVFRHVLRLVEHRGEAEDVTAAAFFDLWRRRADVRIVEGSVLPWLLVTATNHARNVRRGTRRYRSMLSGLPRLEHAEDPALIAGERVQRAADAARLHRAIAALSETDAALLVLTVVEGWTSARAADAVGITHAAARTRLTRARRTVRALLGDERPAEGEL